MRPELEVGRHRLNMDGKWDLLELSSFGRQYVQVYSILYALHFGADKDDPDDRTHHAFGAFPWRGGWSAVGFYESLRVAIPRNHRPHVIAIEYASPGYIDLAVIPLVALGIEWTVDRVCNSIDRINATYTNLYKGAADRKLLKIDARQDPPELTSDDLQFATVASTRLIEAMAIDNLGDNLHILTRNPISTMKIVFSIYRRVRSLAKLQRSNKINF